MTRSRPALALLTVSLFTLSSCNDAANLLTPDAPQNSVVAPMCFGRAATIYPGNPGTGTIVDNGDGSFTITGTAANNVIVGGTGNDVIDAAGGDDRVCAGDGDDTILGGAGRDLMDGEGGHDHLDYTSSPSPVNINLGAGRQNGGDAQDDVIQLVEEITGSAFNDVLRGNGAANTFNGGAGDDALTGNAGDDVLNGGGGADVLIPGAGADVLEGGTEIDIVRYSASPAGIVIDLVAGTGGGVGSDAEGDALSTIENVVGSAFADVIDGDGSANAFDAAGGDDVLRGAGGNDRLNGRSGADELHGGAGNDLLVGEDGDDEMFGDDGDDDLRGGAGTNTIDGGADTDSMISRSCVDIVTNVENYGTACEADATLSTIDAAHATLAADGTSATTITVQLKTAGGANVTVGGHVVVLTTDHGTLTDGTTTATAMTALDQGDGTYTLTLNASTSLETATLTGKVDGAAITDNASVQFVAGAVDHFVVTGTDGNPIGQQASGVAFNIMIVAQDAQNHTATSFPGTVTLTANPGAIALGTSGSFTAGVLASQSVTISSGNDFAITASNGSENGTSTSFTVTANPSAVANNVADGSAPNDSYHGVINAGLSIADGSLDLLANDNLGHPAAAVTHFGAVQCNNGTGSLIAATTPVTQTAAGNSVNLNGAGGCTGGSLQVNADGTLTFTPTATYTGLFRFQYRITNTGGTSDAQVTLAIGVRPTAANSTYGTNVLGNVPINTATSTNTLVTATGDQPVFSITGTTGGAALIATAKTYTFTPNAGFSGAASFTFTVTNGFGTSSAATVGLTVAAPVWFIDRNAVAAGDGRLGTPFQDLSTAYAAATKPAANQSVFLYSSGTSYTSGVTLLAGQKLIGQGATGASFAAVTGVTWPADAGTQPSIGGTNPSLVSGLALGSGNTIQGFNLTGASTLSGTNFGTLTVSEVGINTTAQALNLTTGTIAGSFTQVRSTGGTNNVSLVGVATTGTTTLGTYADALSGATSDGFVINGNNGSFTYAGSITNASAGVAVNITNKSGGTVILSGDLNPAAANRGISVTNNNTGTNTITFSGANQKISAGTATGVNLTNNTGATISFTGGALAVNTTSGNGFVATGGGTVAVTGANNTVNSSAGGTAVNITTTIGGSGVTFYSVNAAGSGTNGIILSNTGGAFLVTGDGASDVNNTTRGRTTAKSGGGSVGITSGGTISGRSGHGVSLTATGAVTLRNMLVQGSGTSGDGLNASTVSGLTLDNVRITGHSSDHGIWGTAIGTLILDHSEIDNNATATGVVEGPDIWNIRLLGVTGTSFVRNSNIHHGHENVFGILTSSGTLNLSVTNTNITDTGATAGGGIAFMVAAAGTANVTVNMQNDSVNRGRARGVHVGTETASSASVTLTVNNSEFRNNGVAVEAAHGSGGPYTYTVTNNNMQTGQGVGVGSLTAININRAGSPSFNTFGLFSGTISGNTIGTAGIANSGSDTGSGIEVESNGSGGITRVAILNNTIREVSTHGIYVAAVDGNIGGTTPPLFEGRIVSNTISNMEAVIGLDAIHVLPGALNTDDVTMCIDIANNNATGIRNGLRVRPSGLPAAPSTVQLEGWDGVTAVNTYFTARPNTLAGGIAAISTTAPPAPGGFVAVANCNTP